MVKEYPKVPPRRSTIFSIIVYCKLMLSTAKFCWKSHREYEAKWRIALDMYSGIPQVLPGSSRWADRVSNSGIPPGITWKLQMSRQGLKSHGAVFVEILGNSTSPNPPLYYVCQRVTWSCNFRQLLKSVTGWCNFLQDGVNLFRSQVKVVFRTK